MTAHALLFTDLVDSTARRRAPGRRARGERAGPSTTAARATCSPAIGGREIDHSDGFFLLFDDAGRCGRASRSAYHEALAALGLQRPRRAARRRGDAARERARRRRARRQADRGRGPRQAARRAGDGAGARRPDAADAKRRARRSATRLADGGGDRGARPLPAEGHRRAGRDLRAGRARRSSFAPPDDTEKAYRVVRGGRRLAAGARGAPQPAARARRLRRPGRGPGGRRRPARRRRAAAHRARPRRHRQDAAGPPLRLELARRLAGRRLLLRPVRGAHARRRLLRRRRRARRAARQGRPRRPARPRDRARGRCLVILDNFEQIVEHAEATVGRWLDRAADAALPGHQPRAAAPRRARRCCRSSRSRSTAEGDRAVRRCARARSGPTSRSRRRNRAAVRAHRRACSTACRSRSSWRRRACGVLSPAQLVERLTRPLRPARRCARRRRPPGDAPRRDRLVVGPARALGAGGARPMLGVRGRLHARRGRGGARPLALARRAVDRSTRSRRSSTRACCAPGCRSSRRATTLEEPYFGMYLSIHEYAAEKLAASGAAAGNAPREERHGRHFAAIRLRRRLSTRCTGTAAARAAAP